MSNQSEIDNSLEEVLETISGEQLNEIELVCRPDPTSEYGPDVIEVILTLKENPLWMISYFPQTVSLNGEVVEPGKGIYSGDWILLEYAVVGFSDLDEEENTDPPSVYIQGEIVDES